MKLQSTCLYCQTEFTYNPHHKRGKYCSSQCQSDHTRQVFVKEWLRGERPGGNSYRLSNYIRRHLLQECDNKCSKCGWSGYNVHTGKPVLEIDHMDDDPYNHSPENLQVLCPNCHAMKTLPPSKSKGGRYKNGTHPKFSPNSAAVAQ